ncbi:MAG: YncE family protein [Deltaproteobacteria bacterium]|nr:YncE family protein [Deltaproteobacteria bacterium]
MKAQISSMNLLPLEKDEKDKKKYSGVYQQQGRMLTDADWNELQDIVKQRQAQAFDKTVKSGVPRNGGILEIVEEEGKYTIKEIKSGALFVDGVYAEVLIGPGEGGFYKKQHGFKKAPELPGEWTSPILYADVWERIVIANEDPDLRDPALHGADTCVRTQVLAQLKYAPDQDALYSLPATGDACFSLEEIKPKGGDKPGGQGASDSASCMPEKASEPRLPNCLFRLEVHEVKGPANNPDSVTLKWSSENGAEAVKYDGDPNQLDSNKEFYRKEYVYEFYNKVTEQHLGVHCQEQEVQRAKLVSHDKLKTEDLKGLNFVRRWDCYCDLKLKHEMGQWIIQKFVSEGTSWENDELRELEAKITSSGEFLLSITVKDATLEMTLKLNKETSGVGGMVTRTFVAGDYWLARIRSDAPKNDQVQVLSETPVGIVHHYLELAEKDKINKKYCIPDTETFRLLSFPPLTDLQADRVQYDPPYRDDLWGDFIDNDGYKSPFDTVQKAIDALILNMGGEKWPLTVGYGGKYENIEIALKKLTDKQDIVLCLLPKPRDVNDPSPVHKIEQDIVKGRSIYLFGSGQEATEVRFHQSVQLKAKEIHLSRIHFQGQGRESQLKLMGEKVTSTHCKFEKAIGNDEALHKWSCVLNTQPPASTGTGRPDPTPPDSGGGGTGRSAVPSASLVVGTRRPGANPPDSGGGGTGGHGGTPPDSGGSTFADTSDRRCVALDADNNVIVAGTFQGTMSFAGYKYPNDSKVTERLVSGAHGDVFVVKFDADGAYLWSRHFGGDETEAIEVNRIVSDSSGDVVLIGSFKGRVTFSNFGEDEDDVLKSPAIKDSGDRSHAVFVVKIDKDGDYMWSHYFGAKEPNVETRYIGTDVAVDTQNYIYLTGVFSGETELNNFKKTNITVTDSLSAYGGTTTFVLKLNSQGDYIWSARLANDIPDSSEKEASAWSTCAVDSKEDLIVVRATEGKGTFSVKIGEKDGKPDIDNKDIFLTDGVVTSICTDKEKIGHGPVMGGSTVIRETPVDIKPHPKATLVIDWIYLAGYFSEQNDNQNLKYGFVSKCNPNNGQSSWERKIGGKHNSHATSLTVDGAHNVYVTGGFEGTINLGGEDLVARHSDLSPPTQDAFLAKFTKKGHHLWSQAFGAEAYSKSNSHAVGPTIAVAANGEIVVTGQCIGQIDLGGGLRGDPSRRGAFIGAFRTPQVLRPIVSLQRRGDHRMELHWLANEMNVTGDDLVRPGDLLALSKNTMGVIRDNVIQGDIRLMSDLSGSQQRIELLKSRLVLNIFHTDGLSLHIQGNRLNSVRANVPAMRVDGEITRIINGYESLTVADNRFNGSPSYFLGRNVVVQGNQFLGRGTNAAVVVSQRLSLTDNVAQEPDAVAFQTKPPGKIRKFRVNDFYVESANGMSKFELTDDRAVFRTGGKLGLYQNAIGNVGIGTIPSGQGTMLEVCGSIKLKNGEPIENFSKDGQLSNASDSAVPTEKAVREYVDTALNERIIPDRRQFVPLLAFTLEGVDYKNGRNARIVVDDYLYGVAFDGTHIWVSIASGTSISKIDVTTNEVVATIVVGRLPYGVAFDGTHIWVSNTDDRSISKIDVMTDKVVATIVVGRLPYGVAFDGTHIWVSNTDDDSISKIDVTTDEVVATIVVGDRPHGVAFDGTHIWVSNTDDDSISKIDVRTNEFDDPIGVGNGPFGVAFDGTHIWVSNMYDRRISKIDVTTDEVVATIVVGGGPNGVAFDGTHIWVSNTHDGSISKIDVTADEVVATIVVGGGPNGVAFDGTHIWVSNTDDRSISKILV